MSRKSSLFQGWEIYPPPLPSKGASVLKYLNPRISTEDEYKKLMEKIPDYKIQPEEVELDTLAIFTNCSFHVHHDEDSRPGHSFLARFYILLNACIVYANMKFKKNQNGRHFDLIENNIRGF